MATLGSDRPIDLAGIAKLLGVASTTPQQWRQRGVLPEPDPELSFPDKPLWRQSAIVAWAKETKRWPRGAAARPRRGRGDGSAQRSA